MNAKTAKLIRRASNYHPSQGAQYEEAKLHRVMQMPAFETYERTIREMGPVSPGAPTNSRFCPLPRIHSFGVPVSIAEHNGVYGAWVPRSGNRRVVTSRVVEKIRYLPDGKTPAKALWRQNTETKAWEPVYTLIPCQKPVHLKAGSPKRVYRELKRLERVIGLDALHERLLAEQIA